MVKYWSDRIKSLNLYILQSILNLTPAFVISYCVQVKQGNADVVRYN